MKAPEYISLSTLQRLSEQLEHWNLLLREIRDGILALGQKLEAHKDENDPRHVVAAELAMAQFFTFSSIAILISQAHFADAYCLLRILYEGHLHLWNICNGSREQAEKFIHLAAIQDWRIATEATAINGTSLRKEYYTDARMSELKARYEAARKYFDSRPGKIPRSYTTLSNKELAKLIDSAENYSRPFRQLMHIRLYSVASEYVHRSLFGIREGFAAIEQKGNEGTRWVLAPNPARGIEAAWWSSLIVLDGAKWYANLLGIRFPNTLMTLRNEAMTLALEWLGPE